MLVNNIIPTKSGGGNNLEFEFVDSYDGTINFENTFYSMVKYVKFAEGTTSITCSDPDTSGNTYYHAILLPNAEEVILPKSLTGTSKNLFVYAYNGGESSIYNKSVRGVIKKLTAPCGVSGLCTYYKSTYYNRNTMKYSSTEATAPLEELVLIEGGSSTVASIYSSHNTLKKLKISNGLQKINDNVLRDCNLIEEILFSNTITSVGSNNYNLNAPYFKNQTTTEKYLDKWLVYNDNTSTTINIKNDTKGIASNTFYQNTNIKTIELPDSVKYIDNSVFYECSYLTSVIANNVKRIGTNAFYYCRSLKSIYLSNCTYIGQYAFQSCTNLTNIDLSNCTYIDQYAFYDCSRLLNVKLSEKLNRIYSSTFQNCTNLSSINIPDSVLRIESYAFYDCSNLKNISIPNISTIFSSSDYATFNNCTSLENIEIPNNVKYLAQGMFYNCTSLKTVKLSNNITHIPYNYRGNLGDDSYQGCFQKCSSLEQIDLPNKLITIDNYAFRGCTSLTSIVIPKTVTKINKKSFYDCTNLAHIYYTGTSSEWSSITKGDYWNTNMGSNVEGGTVIHYNYIPE